MSAVAIYSDVPYIYYIVFPAYNYSAPRPDIKYLLRGTYDCGNNRKDFKERIRGICTVHMKGKFVSQAYCS